jgi:hypothetical protein
MSNLGKDGTQWERDGHKIVVGPWERIEGDRCRELGYSRPGYARPIYIDTHLICWSRGKRLDSAKWRAAEALGILKRRSTPKS